MSKATQAAAVLGSLMLFWFGVLWKLIPIELSPTVETEIWPVLPLVGLVSFGAYSLASIGYALLTFRDCPDAFEELQKEISEAKSDLRAKGIH
ncbi:dolichol-phosphate mannosyltransferase subunit 3 [Ramicandelaber brevisporus]|nr:dolichol-phosphate mannosyltransferase subunit 3 [Ramicandelaber brevisporus]